MQFVYKAALQWCSCQLEGCLGESHTNLYPSVRSPFVSTSNVVHGGRWLFGLLPS